MKAIGWFILGAIAWQGAVMIESAAERSLKYEQAAAHAKLTGKPLLVIGGPYGSPTNRLLNMPSHGYGDVCLDLDPESCRRAPLAEIADIRLIPYPDKYFGAAYASHVLEHMRTVADCNRALTEMSRVSEKIFVSVPTKANIRGWLHADHHLWITERSGSFKIEQR